MWACSCQWYIDPYFPSLEVNDGQLRLCLWTLGGMGDRRGMEVREKPESFSILREYEPNNTYGKGRQLQDTRTRVQVYSPMYTPVIHRV